MRGHSGDRRGDGVVACGVACDSTSSVRYGPECSLMVAYNFLMSAITTPLVTQDTYSAE